MSDCKHLSYSHEITVTHFNYDEKAKEFEKWFKKSKYTEMFDLDHDNMDGEDYLVVVAYHPGFSVMALNEIFIIESNRPKPETKVKSVSTRSH